MSLPDGWKTVQIKDIAREFLSGGTPSTKERDFWNGHIHWTTSAPISEGNVFLSRGERFITEKGLSNSATHLIPKGNLLIGTRVGVGKAVVNLIDVAISQDLTGVVLDTSRVDAEFLALQLKSSGVQSFIDTRKRGVTIQGITRNDLESLNILLPSVPQQRAIARALHACQDAKEARQKELALEREHKAALMQHLFTHGIRGEQCKKTEIGEMPEGWVVSKLSNVGTKMQYGLSQRGNQEGKYPILRMNNLGRGGIDTRDLQFVELDPKTLQSFKLNRGDILFNRTNSYDLVGKTSLFDLTGEFVFASYLVRVIVNRQALLPEYFNGYLNWPVAQDRLRMMATRGVSQSNISAGKLMQFVVPVPSLAEQLEIANVLSACDATIASLEREYSLLDELFHSMLEELISGRLSALALAEEPS